ncbi:hypothetical protein LTR36_010934 [Oleoguttula mirabilis]|uniref:Uncharacterized protein n=1 Tax=Oleoguttula mirabilis TaxID=1507867 RepID=A0AAV9J4B5_9PEZI|nr:hypothetical protein LTR36_010934 [Oleoguttula mirabilis]
MCYTQTLYHSACAHYGRPSIQGEPCIRASTQLGYTGGCDDTTDLGVASVGTVCAKCRRAELGLPLTPPSSGVLTPASETSSPFGTPMTGSDSGYFGLGIDGLKKIDSSVSLASMDSGRSPSTSSPSLRGEEAGVKALPPSPPNLHWRTFGGSKVGAKFKRNVA